MRSRRFALHFLFVSAVVAALHEPVIAQSTLFNIPTTDTVSAKKGYFEFAYLIQAPQSTAGRQHWFAPRIVAGLAPNLEAGANVFNQHIPGDPDATTFSFLQPNIKYRFAASQHKGLAAAAGIIWFTPLNQRESSDSFGLVYGSFSKNVKTGSYGPRITFGPYGIVGSADSYSGTKAGAIVGYEQPIHAKARIVADWFSGVSGFGYFTPGISITLPRNGVFAVGYSIGNDSYSDPHNNNRFFFVYYGITFPR